MHRSDHPDGRRPGRVLRAVRGLVFLALLPAILLAGVILLPVFAIGRLFGLGPRGHGCRGRCGPQRETTDAA